ncbi:esterase/lipase family protein [Actinacidiphila bryophytorum]|uniref:Alpha/beta hydrolase family protein n=1 Tax=Actinacidiphila bryophytorum TaxID=1436133 RepID=A0A9W4GZS3_9ACTN|nr:alpha/beta fold hydrolase [Actinacidiphila bryophytorum]MBM9437987.1 hypothetical protein [Actinacidiphila bryophytorum]MBN6542679.1 hypothetical protein [Actinacidiphila bryophytorum]CAG7617653.1 Alpha/beta hydrolase family protein [Actinacidiphila bryophytorum]
MSSQPQPRLGVVLVHGFISGPQMWQPLQHLITADSDLAGVDTLPFGYATGLFMPAPHRALPTLDTVADSLKEYLDTHAAEYGRLVLVAHSQGGLVVQRWLARMLAEGRGRDLAAVARVVLLACPNNGSQIALSLRRGLLRRNPQERQLRPLTEQVTDTQRIVIRDVVNATAVTDRTCPIPFSVYAGETDRVVPPASARSVFPDAAVLPGDHRAIARPDSPDHRVYRTLKRLIRAELEVREVPPPAAPVTPASAPAPLAASAPAAVPAAAPVPAPAPSREAVRPAAAYSFPDTLRVVAAAERITGMDDPDVRLQVVDLMRQRLAPEWGFSAAYRATTRDHLVEIVERCRTHAAAPAALGAFLAAVVLLRPDEAATVELRRIVGDPR